MEVKADISTKIVTTVISLANLIAVTFVTTQTSCAN